MAHKADRQREILKIVLEQQVGTQGQLRKILQGQGHSVDQATLSRDIRDLGLVKVASDGGGYRYAPLEDVSPAVRTQSESSAARLIRSIETSRNLVVVKTDPGNAPSVGLALDRLHWTEVIGTIAGDDTILLVVREGARTGKVVKRIEELGR